MELRKYVELMIKKILHIKIRKTKSNWVLEVNSESIFLQLLKANLETNKLNS